MPNEPAEHPAVDGKRKDVYQKRYCAYVDILGFRTLVSQLRRGDREVATLRRLLTQIHEPFQGSAETRYGEAGDFKAQSISDAVAISTAVNPTGLLHLFYVLEDLTTDLLFEGYFARGAIVKGRLYHDSKMVFGEALISAFEFESQVARFPRIMVTSEVARDVRDIKADRFPDRIRQADDGPYFLHILHRLTDEIRKHVHESPEKEAEENDELNYYVQIADKVRRRFREAVDNPRHFEKVQWFARYWNSTIEPHSVKGLGRIRGPGLDRAPGVWAP